MLRRTPGLRQRITDSPPGKRILQRALSILRAKGGSLYMAGPANRIASDGSGTAAVANDPIGYVRDLARDELGPELASPNGWMLGAGTSQTADTITYASPADSTSVTQAGKLVVGSLYRVAFTVNAYAGTGAGFRMLLGTGTSSAYQAVPGTVTQTLLCTGTTSLYLQGLGAGVVGSVSNISVREVRAATQTTTGFKPKLVREPILGPELVVNGDFSGGTTGWNTGSVTLSAVAGELVCTSVIANFPATYTQLLTEAGKRYKVSGQIRQGTWTGSTLLEIGGGVLSRNNNSTAVKVLEGEFTATLTNHKIYLTFGSGTTTAGTTIIADNISCREILGYKDVWGWAFDGVDDRLTGAVNLDISASLGFLVSIALAAKRKPTSNERVLALRTVAGGVTIGANVIHKNGGGYSANMSDGTVHSNVETVSVDDPLGTRRVLSFWFGAARQESRINGVVSALKTGSVQQASIPAAALWLGCESNNSAFLSDDVCCVAIATNITTLAEVQAIERAVAAAAGITL